MILVDSSVWIDYFNGSNNWQTNLLDNLLTEIPVIVGDLILIEVLQGFKSEKDFNLALKGFQLLQFRQLGGYEFAVQSAQNFRKLKKKGITVRKTIDMIIGTFCIQENIPLLHRDKDFKPMEKYLGLRALSESGNADML